MNRRNFLATLVGGVATAAAVRTWPFRVFSFPSPVVAPTPDEIKALADYFYKDTPFLRYVRVGQNLIASNPRAHATITGITVPTDDEVRAFA